MNEAEIRLMVRREFQERTGMDPNECVFEYLAFLEGEVIIARGRAALLTKNLKGNDEAD